MSVEIRPATDADGEAIAALVAGVFADYPACPFVRAEFPELDAPAQHYRDLGGGLWVADRAGTVVGSFGLSRPEPGLYELHKVYLARSERGRGLATDMLRLALTYAHTGGGRRLRLWTDTRFVEGHRFYERHGFHRLGVVRYLADATRAWEFAYGRALKPALE